MSSHQHPPREGVCIDKMTVSAVTGAILLSLGAAAVLAWNRIPDMPQAFLGVAGAGLAGLLALAQGKKSPASQPISAGPGGTVNMQEPAAVEPAAAPAADPTRLNGPGTG